MPSIEFIDSHTAGEPTRVIVSGGPDLGDGPLEQRVERFRAEFDEFRRTVILEPRGSEAVVGALLCEPTQESCAAGVIFFNNLGYLGMCGHGAMGLATTLFYQGKIDLGKFLLDTPVGVVEVDLQTPHRSAIQNVPSYRFRERVTVNVPGLGALVGDVAWGGNWFFLVEESPLPLEDHNILDLTDVAWQTLLALEEEGITGAYGEAIDHVEFFGPSDVEGVDSKNFVICPGGAYDRSPCGTGTSAKVACLASAGKLQPGETWVQESIIGSRFTATYQTLPDNRILPTITGEAYITAEGRLLQTSADPFQHGIVIGRNS